MLRTEIPLWEALRDATERLASSGSLSPRVEAERLAAHTLDVRWGELWSRLREPFGPIEEFDTFVSRRVTGEPLAYIVGSASFYGHELVCGPGVLVPRPETESLVDEALERVREVTSPVVVDLGTGTGAVAIAIAAARPDADVTATDVSQEALWWAAQNVDRRVRLRHGDLFDALETSLRGRIDLIVSDPPYVPDDSLLPADVGAEPPVALFGGPDGNDLLRRIVDEAPEWLRPDGAVALEVGWANQADLVAGMFEGWHDTRIRNDLSGRPRVVSARR